MQNNYILQRTAPHNSYNPKPRATNPVASTRMELKQRNINQNMHLGLMTQHSTTNSHAVNKGQSMVVVEVESSDHGSEEVVMTVRIDKPVGEGGCSEGPLVVGSNQCIKQRVRKVSEETATYELLQFGETDFPSGKARKQKPKQKTRKYTDTGLHELVIRDRRARSIHTLDAYEQSVAEDQLQGEEAQREISNFQLLKKEAEKLESSNIVVSQQPTRVSQKNKNEYNFIGSSKKSSGNRLPPHLKSKQRRKSSASAQNAPNQASNRPELELLRISQLESSKLGENGRNFLSFAGTFKSKFISGNGLTNRTSLRHSIQNNPLQTGKDTKNNENRNRKDNTNRSCTQFNRYSNTSFSIAEASQAQGHNKETSQYMINKQFVPMASRAVIDKNRQNIKKIGNTVSRILKRDSKSRTFTETDVTSNQLIGEFIKTKLSLAYKPSEQPAGKARNASQKHNKMLTSNSFYSKPSNLQHSIQHPPPARDQLAELNKLVADIGLESQLQEIKQVPVQLAVKNEANSRKHMTMSNAAKFYKAQYDKNRCRSQILVPGSFIKTKSIDIGAKETSRTVNAGNDTVIICL